MSYVIHLFALIFYGAQWFFLIYFIGYNVCYLILFIISFFHLRHYEQERELDMVPRFYGPLMPSISILVPAYNEENSITASVESLLDLIYPDYDIIVVNDGSIDKTMQRLIDAFNLEPVPSAYAKGYNTKPIKRIYRSKTHLQLKVIDKENGGKADALNAGLTMSSNDLVCCVDADSVLQLDSLLRVVHPFIEEPLCVAAGGTIRIANGTKMTAKGQFKVGLPTNMLALIQVVEYLRAFLFGRMGWSPLNALLIVSGAFSMFKREVLLEVGGYKTNTVGEDMELIVRLHRHFLLHNKPYKVLFVPDPICWTEAPEDLATLRNQRQRWQRGLLESLSMNMELLFHPRAGLVGWVAFPFFLFFEAVGPAVELFGLILMTIGFLFGWVSTDMFLALMVAAIGLGFMLSLNAMLLEEMSFHVYKRFTDLARLFFALCIENFGYRQLTTWWRLKGTLMWVLRQKQKWGTMKRQAHFKVS